MVTFDSIPDSLLAPIVAVEFDPTQAQQGPTVKAYRALMVGQMLDTGTASPLTPTLVTSYAQARTLFGAGSMLAGMAQAWFANNATTELWCVAIEDDGGWTAAGRIVGFTGTTTAAGTLHLYLGGRKVAVTLPSGTTAVAARNAVRDAIAADDDLQVTAADQGDDLLLNAKNAGAHATGYPVRLNYNPGESNPAGLTVGAADLVAGAGVPDLSAVWAALGEVQYDVLVVPYTDPTALASIDAELADRWGPMRSIEGLCFTATQAPFSDAVTAAASLNTPHVVMPVPGESPSPAFEHSAAVAAAVALSAAADPARPFQTLELEHVLPPVAAQDYSYTERNTLLTAGLATLRRTPGGKFAIDRLVTLYTQNAVGAVDPAYRDANTMLTLGYLRYDLRTQLATKLARFKLADSLEGVLPGSKVATPATVRAEVVAIARGWLELGLLENLDDFQAGLVVERDSSDPNRVNLLLPPDLVNQLRVTAAAIQFRL